MIASWFTHPLPRPGSHHILPVFLPFQGCPSRCLYCSSPIQTGTGTLPLERSLGALREELEERSRAGAVHLEIGFFGGTFTALPDSWQERFLDLVASFRRKGVVGRVRCSTRPDAVDTPRLNRLRALGMDTVELGVQSFDPEVLALCNRRYTGEEALEACRLVRRSGMEVIVQLLPGLPGHGPGQWLEDLSAVCLIGPEAVRIYPCLVLRSTGLADLWAQNRYRPWTLEDTVERLASGAALLAGYSIPVIRMGLAPEPRLLEDILAGPWHPALGFLVRSRSLHAALRAQIRRLSSPPSTLMVPRNLLPEVIGHRGHGRTALARMGLPPAQIHAWDVEHFLLAATKHQGAVRLSKAQPREGSGCTL
jgi:histone acetyltransferase (RNA polymerase elongator complex component)